MSFHRRFLLGGVAGACGGSTAGLASAGAFASDQTLTLQKAINFAAKCKVPLQLQPGRYVCSGLKIHPSLGYKVWCKARLLHFKAKGLRLRLLIVRYRAATLLPSR